MTKGEAINRLQDAKDGYKEYLTDEALDMAIEALELLDTLTDRPCSVCRHHKERTEQEVGGCCKWNCVFDGHIGG